MSVLRLRFIQTFQVNGERYYYFRRRGQRVRLPGLPGSREFMEAYQAALDTAPAPIGKNLRSKPGSVSAAIAEYYGSQAFRTLRGGTPALRRAILEKFREQYGDRILTALPKSFIVGLLDTMIPGAARNWLVSFRHFIRWCESRKLIRNDPTSGIRIQVPASDGHHTWTEGELELFEQTHAIGTKPRLAFAIGLYTGAMRCTSDTSTSRTAS
jgi:hypothetical protein